jgi:hypothetical protein
LLETHHRSAGVPAKTAGHHERWVGALVAGCEPPLETSIFFAIEAISDRCARRIATLVEITCFVRFRTPLEVCNVSPVCYPRGRRFFASDRSGAFCGSQVLDRERGRIVTLAIADQF